VWPPVVAFHDLDGPIDAWVSVYWWVMVCFDNFALACQVFCDDYSPFFVPDVVQLFELMGVDPWFKLFFVLMML
jgi:hypothetical protein